MIPFMIWATVVGALLGLAASRVETALQGRGVATRWAWMTTLLASLGAGAWALVRPPVTPGAAPSGWSGVPVAYLAELRDAVVPPPSVMERVDAVALALWLAASLVLALALAGGLVRLARKTRGWTPARVSDAVVLLSDDFGPAVVGVRAPKVVLPRWALGLAPEHLRLVVLHEEEHRKARDVALLLAGWVSVIVAPWNVALWWQFHRLRGAVEMDCDARVLRRGAPAAMYGRLLLEMGSRAVGLSLPVAALSRPPSLLERRLTMIVRGGERGSAGRMAGALAVAGALLVVACETPMPTAVRPVTDESASAEVAEGMAAGVVSARSDTVEGLLMKVAVEGVQPIYMVDGERVEDIAGIAPETIVRVEVVKGAAAAAMNGAEAAGGIVHIVTLNASAALRDAQVKQESGASGGLIKVRGTSEARVYVDGQLFEGDVKSIDPNTIDRVEVLKGKLEGEPSTIHITLKRPGG